MPPKKRNTNRFASLNSDTTGDEDDEFKRLMQKRKQEIEALRKQEHEAAKAAKAQQQQQKEKKEQPPQQKEAAAPAAAAAAAESSASPAEKPKPKKKKAVAAAAPPPAAPKTESPAQQQQQPSPAAAAAATALAETSSSTSPKNNSNDNDDDDDEGSLPAASPFQPPTTQGEQEQEEEILDVMDKFMVAHSSTIDEIAEEEEDKEEGEAAPAAASAAVPEQKQTTTTEQQESQEEQQFADHGVLRSTQKKLDRQAKQHFDYFLLLDFECSCDEGPGFDHEIIEIPALLFDTGSLRIVDEFHTYCRPLRNPVLTPFCTQLTGIKQQQVDKAPCYDEAISQLVSWLNGALKKQQQQQQNATSTTTTASAGGRTVCVMTDGPCDLELFAYMFQHRRDGFAYPQVFNRYLDVKQTFRNEYSDGKFLKIREMLSVFGLSFQGHQHSGIDDTRNLSRIVAQMIQRGTVFSEVYHVTNTSGRQRVPKYLYDRAWQAVKKMRTRNNGAAIGIGPQLAEKARARQNSLLAAVPLDKISLTSWIFKRVTVRAGESVTVPSTALLVVLFCIFLSTVFAV